MTRTGGKLSKDQANIVSEAHGIVNHGPGINWQDKHETISVLTNGFVVRSAIDRKNNPSLLSGNSPNFLKVAGSDTLDQLSIFEYYGKSKGGPPLHKHPFQDETKPARLPANHASVAEPSAPRVVNCDSAR